LCHSRLNIQLGALPHDALPAAVRAHPCVPCRRDRSSKRQDLASAILDGCITDAGYRGHNAPPHHKFKVYTSGQKRRVTPQIKREFKRTSRNTTAWTAITLPMPAAMPSTTCSPPPATTFAAYSHG